MSRWGGCREDEDRIMISFSPLRLPGVVLLAATFVFGVASVGAGAGQRFAYPEVGLVHDGRTDLLWMRCAMGQSLRNGRCAGTAERMSWTSARDGLENLRAGGCPWRLPEFHELRSLLDPEERDPAIDSEAFPDTPTGWFWTRTSAGGHSQHDCFVDFSGDGAIRCNMSGRLYVRPVVDPVYEEICP